MKNTSNVIAFIAIVGAAGTALAGNVANINGIVDGSRTFNDFPNSNLSVVNNYPSSVLISESNFGIGNFANRHIMWFSDDAGSSRVDFDYADAFDLCITMDLDSENVEGREAGFQADLFGFGFFGVLPNGEIAAFGSILPFQSFGVVANPTDPLHLRMIHRPGDGDGTIEGVGSTPSTIEYLYDNGGGWISSGQIAFGNGEGGIPDSFAFNLGFGIQARGTHGTLGGKDEVPATPYSVLFSNIRTEVPAPGTVGVLGLAGLVGLRRRR